MSHLSFILIILLCSAFIAAVFYLFFQIVLLLFFWGGIYVPTREETVKKIINLVKIKPGETAVDLGSGDGRLVIALARAGAQTHGYEINPFLVWLSKRNIRKAGFSGKAFVHQRSFWSEDISGFDIVVVFGISHIMKRLEKKLTKELKKGTRIVSVGFALPTRPASLKDDKVYLYHV